MTVRVTGAGVVRPRQLHAVDNFAAAKTDSAGKLWRFSAPASSRERFVGAAGHWGWIVSIVTVEVGTVLET